MTDNNLEMRLKGLNSVCVLGGGTVKAERPDHLGGLGYRSLPGSELDKTGPMPAYGPPAIPSGSSLVSGFWRGLPGLLTTDRHAHHCGLTGHAQQRSSGTPEGRPPASRGCFISSHSHGLSALVDRPRDNILWLAGR